MNNVKSAKDALHKKLKASVELGKMCVAIVNHSIGTTRKFYEDMEILTGKTEEGK